MNDHLPKAPIDGVIEIQDPEIDVEQIMGEIRARIEQRRQELGYENRLFPSFGMAGYPSEPKDIAYDADLHHYLRLVNDHYWNVETKPILVPSPTTRLPIVGKLWSAIRGTVHELVLFYVNRAVAHQTQVNSYLVSVLNRTTVVIEEQQRTIDRLTQEIRTLKRNAPP